MLGGIERPSIRTRMNCISRTLSVPFFFIYKLHGAHKPIICTVLRTLCRGSSLYEEDQQVTQQNKSTEDYEKDFVIEEPKRRCDSISLYNNKNENKEPYLYTHTAAQV